jgi:hypothetical protein
MTGMVGAFPERPSMLEIGSVADTDRARVDVRAVDGEAPKHNEAESEFLRHLHVDNVLPTATDRGQ